MIVASSAILLATLTPVGDSGPTPGPWCIACGAYGGQDALANVVLFAPLGIALALADAGYPTGLLFPALLSLIVELLQWRLVPGRDSSLSDLLANAIGGAGGFWLTQSISGLRKRVGPALVPPLAIGTIAVWLTTMAILAWALLPASFPETVWVQHNPPRRGFEPFFGMVGVKTDSIELLNGDSVDTRRHAGLGGDTLSLTLDLMRVRNAPVSPAALILRLATPSRVIVQVSQQRGDLLFHSTHNAARLRLRQPTFRLPGALERGRDHVIVHIEGSGAEIRLRAVNDSGWVVGDTLSINVGRAWELLAPATLLPPWIFRLAGPASLVGSAVVVALLCAAAWPTLVALSVTVVTMALGVAIIPMALGIHSIGGADVVGVAIGVLAGMQLGGWTRRGTRSR